MNAHIGEEFQGTVVSAVEFGLFIALPDTCEGLLHTDNMPVSYTHLDVYKRQPIYVAMRDGIVPNKS